MKDKELHILAEQLCVCDFLSLEEVAKRIGVNDRTIRRWRKGEDWHAKRRQFIDKHSYIHEDLYQLARRKLDKINEDMDKCNKINAGRLNQLMNIIVSMLKSHKTEQMLNMNRKQQCNANTEINFDKRMIDEFLKMLE